MTSTATRREWIGLAVIALPCLVYAMDLTVLTLALPAISADLQPSSAQLLWIVDVYGFLVAGSLITMGTLGDRIGRRRLLLIGAAAFAAASVLAALSTSATMLIVARALLGIAGGTLAPSTLSLISAMFRDPGERSRAIGIWVASFSLGAAIGPLVGGALLEHFRWGSVFLPGVPVMLLLLVVGPRLLPEFREPGAARLDVRSAALSLGAVLAAVYGLKHLAQDGAGLAPALWIAAGAVLGVVFVRRQRRLADPLIDLALFRLPAFTAALATNLLGFFAIFGVAIFVSQYLQSVLGFSPLTAGLWSVPEAMAYVASSMLTPLLAARVRPAVVIVAGLLTGALGLVVIAALPGGLAPVVVGSVVSALGLGAVATLATDLVVASAPPEHAGAAAAISETGSELGGALGIAVLGSIATAVYRGALGGDVPASVRDSLGGAVAAGGHHPALLDTARDAFTEGFHVAASVSAAVLVAAAIVAAVLLARTDEPAGAAACARA